MGTRDTKTSESKSFTRHCSQYDELLKQLLSGRHGSSLVDAKFRKTVEEVSYGVEQKGSSADERKTWAEQTKLAMPLRDVVSALSVLLRCDVRMVERVTGEAAEQDTRTGDTALEPIVQAIFAERAALYVLAELLVLISTESSHRLHEAVRTACKDYLLGEKFVDLILDNLRYNLEFSMDASCLDNVKGAQGVLAAVADNIVAQCLQLFRLFITVMGACQDGQLQRRALQKLSELLTKYQFGNSLTCKQYVGLRGVALMSQFYLLAGLSVVSCFPLRELLRQLERFQSGADNLKEDVENMQKHPLLQLQYLQQLDAEYIASRWQGAAVFSVIHFAWATLQTAYFQQQLYVDPSYKSKSNCITLVTIISDRFEQAFKSNVLEVLSGAAQAVRPEETGSFRSLLGDKTQYALYLLSNHSIFAVSLPAVLAHAVGCFLVSDAYSACIGLNVTYSQLCTLLQGLITMSPRTQMLFLRIFYDTKHPLLQQQVPSEQSKMASYLRIVSAIIKRSDNSTGTNTPATQQPVEAVLATFESERDMKIVSSSALMTHAEALYKRIPTITTILPPLELLSISSDQMEATLLKDWLSPMGCVIPQGTQGAAVVGPQGTQAVQWTLEWSLLPVLVLRLATIVREQQRTSLLDGAQMEELTAILEFLGTLVTQDSAQLQALDVTVFKLVQQYPQVQALYNLQDASAASVIRSAMQVLQFSLHAGSTQAHAADQIKFSSQILLAGMTVAADATVTAMEREYCLGHLDERPRFALLALAVLVERGESDCATKTNTLLWLQIVRKAVFCMYTPPPPHRATSSEEAKADSQVFVSIGSPFKAIKMQGESSPSSLSRQLVEAGDTGALYVHTGLHHSWTPSTGTRTELFLWGLQHVHAAVEWMLGLLLALDDRNGPCVSVAESGCEIVQTLLYVIQTPCPAHIVANTDQVGRGVREDTRAVALQHLTNAITLNPNFYFFFLTVLIMQETRNSGRHAPVRQFGDALLQLLAVSLNVSEQYPELRTALVSSLVSPVKQAPLSLEQQRVLGQNMHIVLLSIASLGRGDADKVLQLLTSVATFTNDTSSSNNAAAIVKQAATHVLIQVLSQGSSSYLPALLKTILEGEWTNVDMALSVVVLLRHQVSLCPTSMRAIFTIGGTSIMPTLISRCKKLYLEVNDVHTQYKEGVPLVMQKALFVQTKGNILLVSELLALFSQLACSSLAADFCDNHVYELLQHILLTNPSDIEQINEFSQYDGYTVMPPNAKSMVHALTGVGLCRSSVPVPVTNNLEFIYVLDDIKTIHNLKVKSATQCIEIVLSTLNSDKVPCAEAQTLLTALISNDQHIKWLSSMLKLPPSLSNNADYCKLLGLVTSLGKQLGIDMTAFYTNKGKNTSMDSSIIDIPVLVKLMENRLHTECNNMQLDRMVTVQSLLSNNSLCKHDVQVNGWRISAQELEELHDLGSIPSSSGDGFVSDVVERDYFVEQINHGELDLLQKAKQWYRSISVSDAEHASSLFCPLRISAEWVHALPITFGDLDQYGVMNAVKKILSRQRCGLWTQLGAHLVRMHPELISDDLVYRLYCVGGSDTIFILSKLVSMGITFDSCDVLERVFTQCASMLRFLYLCSRSVKEWNHYAAKAEFVDAWMTLVQRTLVKQPRFLGVGVVQQSGLKVSDLCIRYLSICALSLTSLPSNQVGCNPYSRRIASSVAATMSFLQSYIIAPVRTATSVNGVAFSCSHSVLCKFDDIVPVTRELEVIQSKQKLDSSVVEFVRSSRTSSLIQAVLSSLSRYEEGNISLNMVLVELCDVSHTLTTLLQILILNSGLLHSFGTSATLLIASHDDFLDMNLTDLILDDEKGNNMPRLPAVHSGDMPVSVDNGVLIPSLAVMTSFLREAHKSILLDGKNRSSTEMLTPRVQTAEMHDRLMLEHVGSPQKRAPRPEEATSHHQHELRSSDIIALGRRKASENVAHLAQALQTPGDDWMTDGLLTLQSRVHLSTTTESSLPLVFSLLTCVSMLIHPVVTLAETVLAQLQTASDKATSINNCPSITDLINQESHVHVLASQIPVLVVCCSVPSFTDQCLPLIHSALSTLRTSLSACRKIIKKRESFHSSDDTEHTELAAFHRVKALVIAAEGEVATLLPILVQLLENAPLDRAQRATAVLKLLTLLSRQLDERVGEPVVVSTVHTSINYDELPLNAHVLGYIPRVIKALGRHRVFRECAGLFVDKNVVDTDMNGSRTDVSGYTLRASAFKHPVQGFLVGPVQNMANEDSATTAEPLTLANFAYTSALRPNPWHDAWVLALDFVTLQAMQFLDTQGKVYGGLASLRVEISQFVHSLRHRLCFAVRLVSLTPLTVGGIRETLATITLAQQALSKLQCSESRLDDILVSRVSTCVFSLARMVADEQALLQLILPLSSEEEADLQRARDWQAQHASPYTVAKLKGSKSAKPTSSSSMVSPPQSPQLRHEEEEDEELAFVHKTSLFKQEGKSNVKKKKAVLPVNEDEFLSGHRTAFGVWLVQELYSENNFVSQVHMALLSQLNAGMALLTDASLRARGHLANIYSQLGRMVGGNNNNEMVYTKHCLPTAEFVSVRLPLAIDLPVAFSLPAAPSLNTIRAEAQAIDQLARDELLGQRLSVASGNNGSSSGNNSGTKDCVEPGHTAFGRACPTLQHLMDALQLAGGVLHSSSQALEARAVARPHLIQLARLSHSIVERTLLIARAHIDCLTLVKRVENVRRNLSPGLPSLTVQAVIESAAQAHQITNYNAQEHCLQVNYASSLLLRDVGDAVRALGSTQGVPLYTLIQKRLSNGQMLGEFVKQAAEHYGVKMTSVKTLAKSQDDAAKPAAEFQTRFACTLGKLAEGYFRLLEKTRTTGGALMQSIFKHADSHFGVKMLAAINSQLSQSVQDAAHATLLKNIIIKSFEDGNLAGLQ